MLFRSSSYLALDDQAPARPFSDRLIDGRAVLVRVIQCVPGAWPMCRVRRREVRGRRRRSESNSGRRRHRYWGHRLFSDAFRSLPARLREQHLFVFAFRSALVPLAEISHVYVANRPGLGHPES